MSKVDWSLAPEGATHYGEVSSNRICWYSVKSDCRYDYAYQNEGYHAEKWTPSGGAPGHPPLIPRPKPKPWSGPEDGLPPTGTVCEHKRVHEWQQIEVFAVKPNYNGSNTALFTYGNGCWGGCAEPSFFRAIPSQAQLRETAIRELMDIAGVDCRVTAARLVDAGFKREACKSDCSTNNRGVPELLGPCDCR